jgi:RimJ/RimL family protein N-acetyltransferase
MNAQLNEAAPEAFPWVTRDEVFRVETPRLWLRWPRLADAPALQRIAGVASVAEMTSTWPHPLPEGEAGRRIAAARCHNRDGLSLILAITRKGDPDTLIGTIGSGPPAEGAASIGYLLDPAHHGRGLATEAVGSLVRMLFTHTGIELIAASCRIVNPASRRVLEKNGFEVVRTGPSETKVRGTLETDFLELSRSEWKHGVAALRRARMEATVNLAAADRDISAVAGGRGLI